MSGGKNDKSVTYPDLDSVGNTKEEVVAESPTSTHESEIKEKPRAPRKSLSHLYPSLDVPAIDRPRKIDTDIITWMVESEDKSHWESFHPGDGARLESALQAGQKSCVVDNGRFTVDLAARTMSPVYYSADSRRVIRGSWFFFAPTHRLQVPRPLEEEDAVLVEEFFRLGNTNVELPLSDGVHNVIFEEVADSDNGRDKLGASSNSADGRSGPEVLSSPRSRSGSIGVLDRRLSSGSNGMGPELVIAFYQRNDKRGHRVNIYRGFPDWVEDEHGHQQPDVSPERTSDESLESWIDVEPSPIQPAKSFFEEPKDSRKVDHLVLVIHGMGENYWDRHNSLTVTSNTATFRKTVAKLKKSHPSLKQDVEFLPIKWDHILHEETNIHQRLDDVTLNTSGRIREVANYALIDLLCYVQSNHRRRICNEVVRLANDIYKKFCEKNPAFKGNVSFMAHSLGGAVIFDILRHQKSRSVGGRRSEEKRPLQTLKEERDEETQDNSVGQLEFPVHSVFAMGSPAAMLSIVSDLKIREDFNLPTCKRFYNIFHPKDPVAYRMEPMIDKEFTAFPPVMMEHHKGRQRMHLEIERTITKKRKHIKKGLKDTGDLINETFAKMFKPKKKGTEKVEGAPDAEVGATTSARTSLDDEEDVPVPEHGLALNDGRRVDFRLQDTLLEHHSEILASLAVHSCYWTSRDCALFMFRRIFGEERDRNDSGDICFESSPSKAPYPLGS